MNPIRRGLFSNVTSWSKRGRALPPRSHFVPRVDDSLTDIAIYLYQTRAHAEAGSDIGGTGFLVGIPVDGVPDHSWIVAVTNRHIIEQGASVVRVNNKAGSTSVFEIPQRDWLFHEGGQDLAVVPLRVHQDFHRYKMIGIADGILTRDKFAELDVGLGTDTFLVGRFIGRDGGQTNVPTVRFGNIAQMPTLITNEFGQPQESLLIETRSIGGYSGSPVFGYRPPFQLKPGAPNQLEEKHWGPALIGVNWGHAGQADCVFDLQGDELEMFVQSNTGLAFATPSWRLLELLNSAALHERLKVAPQLVGPTDFSLPPELRFWGP